MNKYEKEARRWRMKRRLKSILLAVVMLIPFFLYELAHRIWK